MSGVISGVCGGIGGIGSSASSALWYSSISSSCARHRDGRGPGGGKACQHSAVIDAPTETGNRQTASDSTNQRLPTASRQ